MRITQLHAFQPRLHTAPRDWRGPLGQILVRMQTDDSLPYGRRGLASMAISGIDLALWGLHAMAGLDPHPVAETGRPWIDWVGGQPAFERGTIRFGHAPGFGVHFDPAIFA